MTQTLGIYFLTILEYRSPRSRSGRVSLYKDSSLLRSSNHVDEYQEHICYFDPTNVIGSRNGFDII